MAQDPKTGKTSPGATSKTLTAQGETQEAVPRMPHEHDESADSQSRAPTPLQDVGRAAHEDARRGAPDTTRAEQADATYHRLREDARAEGPASPATENPAGGQAPADPGRPHRP